MRTSRAIAIVLGAAVLAQASLAQATAPAVDLAAARQHHSKGQDLVAAGRFEEAYAEFEAGYSVSQKPLFLFNMGECARAQGEQSQAQAAYAQARAAYAHYLELEPQGKMAELARQRMDELQAREARAAQALAERKRRVELEAARAQREAAAAAKARSSAGTPPPSDAVAAPVPAVLVEADAAAAEADPPLLQRWQLWAGGAVVGAVLLAAAVGSVAAVIYFSGQGQTQEPEPCQGDTCINFND